MIKMKLKLFIPSILIGIIMLGCTIQKNESFKYKRYRDLKTALKNRSNVQLLDLSSQDLKEVPKEVYSLTNLRVLILTKNEISSISNDIEKLKNLEKLELMNNNLESLPDALKSLKKLKRVNVSYNRIYEKDILTLRNSMPDCLIITDIVL